MLFTYYKHLIIWNGLINCSMLYAKPSPYNKIRFWRIWWPFQADIGSKAWLLLTKLVTFSMFWALKVSYFAWNRQNLQVGVSSMYSSNFICNKSISPPFLRSYTSHFEPLAPLWLQRSSLNSARWHSNGLIFLHLKRLTYIIHSLITC